MQMNDAPIRTSLGDDKMSLALMHLSDSFFTPVYPAPATTTAWSERD
jgi:hypothetical protein